MVKVKMNTKKGNIKTLKIGTKVLWEDEAQAIYMGYIREYGYCFADIKTERLGFSVESKDDIRITEILN